MAAARDGSTVLRVEHLTMRFGGLVAIDNLSFDVKRGTITALIGPNGAGKTTVFNCITGFYKPTSGSMRLTHDNGAEIRLERLNDFRISKQAKVARTFQNIRLFPGMTALENLMVAQHNALMRASGLTFLGLIGAPSWRVAEKAAIDLAKFWLDRIGLLDRAGTRSVLGGGLILWSAAQMLTGGVQQYRTFLLLRVLLGMGEAPF